MYFLIVFILFILYLITDTYYVLLLAILLSLLALISGMCMFLYASKMYIKIVNEKEKWHLLYNSKHAFPIGNIHLKADVYNCFFEETVCLDQCFIVNCKKMNVPLKVQYKVGLNVLQNKTAKLKDILSIFAKKFETINAEKVCIYPQSVEVENVDAIYAIFEKRANEKSDEYDIREFRRGDSIKDVHHKISFKKGKLMVKEKHKIQDDIIHLLLDLSGDEMDCAKVFTYFHYFVQCVQNYDEICVIYWYTKDVLYEMGVKTIADEERIVEMILSMPKATINEKRADMWVINASGLMVGEHYE